MRRELAVPLMLMIALVSFAGCGGKKPPKDVPTADATPEGTQEPREAPPPPPPPERPIREVTDPDFPPADSAEGFGAEKVTQEQIDDWNIEGILRTVYFGFDRHDLSSSTTTTLKENAEWLKGHPDIKVVIEGHCDERGTIEYNLALGERRARSIREYFAALGLDESRFRIVTFGEERPVATAHDESSWSRNRRAEFIIER